MPERLVIVTCETEGCENSGIPIEIFTDATLYHCGGCNQFMTNAVEKNAGTDA